MRFGKISASLAGMKAQHLIIAIFSIGLAACSPKLDNRGYVANAQWGDVVKVGQTTKQEILDNFGSPSAHSTFGDESWYYVSSRKETTAFFKPEIAQQDTVRLTFDAADVVTNIEYFDKNQGQDLAMVKRETPTEGHSLGFFEQLLGNVGRFNKPSNGSDSIAPGRKGGRGGI